MRSKLQKERRKKIEQLLLSSKVAGNDCWQEKNSKSFKNRLRMNHLEERGNDTIQERLNSDSKVKCATI
jgi:hypothetical protein